MNDFLEIKRHKNKPDQQFHCDLLHREPTYAVLRYVADIPGLIADIHIPAGSTTIAHYWQDRTYVLWRMFDSNCCLIGTLFHICTHVCIQPNQLSYDDLVLDIWISPDNQIRILDEDELQACITDGQISPDELKLIRATQHEITSNHETIIAALKAVDLKHA